MYTRREFGKIALASLPLPALAATGTAQTIGGVHLGVQTYCFRALEPSVRNLPPGDPRHEEVLNRVLKAMTDLGVTECELWAPHVAHGSMEGMLVSIGRPVPADEAARQRLEAGRKWHLSTPLEYFKNIRKKFKGAGIEIYGYNTGWFGTEEEIIRTFEHTKALGAKCITLSGTMSLAKKLAPYADQHKVIIAMHPHSRVDDPEQFATADSLTKPLAMSKYFWINLDIGHFTAGGYDAVEFIEKYHDRITNLHVKDRKKNQGPNMPLGQGDTPIREVLQLLKTKKYPIPAYLEYEYEGKEGPVEEVRKSLAYMKSCLS